MKKTVLVLAVAATVALSGGCASKKAVKRSEPASTGQEAASKATENLEPVSKTEMTAEELAQVQKILSELQDVPFDFDSYSIPTEGLEIIKKDVALLNELLRARGKYVRIAVEGHTDERGSGEYNLALGERRAKTVKEYLLNVGFMEQSLHMISYGEERPKVTGNNDEAWAANRRVHFVVE